MDHDRLGATPIPTPPLWAAELRAQGRSMTWLAAQVGVQRTYLQDVAAGRRQPSADLEQRIAFALNPSPDRLAAARDHARWREIEHKAVDLASSIRAVLGEKRQ